MKILSLIKKFFKSPEKKITYDLKKLEKKSINFKKKKIIIFYAILILIFSGNSKYLYLHFCKNNKYELFLNLHERIFNELTEKGLPIIGRNHKYRKIHDILLSANIFFADFDYFRTNPTIYSY